MIKLSAKQESFAQAIAKGMTQADAYRKAYPSANRTEKTVHENASRLAKNVKVASRVKELKGNLEQKALWTREMSVKALVAAYKEGSAGVKVSAVKELNLMHGYNAPEKVDLHVSGIMPPTQILIVAGTDGDSED